MPDWIKVRAAEIRSAEEEKRAERNRQIEAAHALKVKVEPFWEDLVRTLQDAVKEFNSEFPEAERQIEQFDKAATNSFSIRRVAFPAALVRVQLNNSGNSAHYTISRTPKKGTEAIEKQGNLVFGLTDGEVAYLDEGLNKHEDVAKLFLEPFFQF